MYSLLKIFSILFLVLVLSAAVIILPKLTFDDSLQNWVPQDSEIINDYRTFLNEFKSDALIIVSIVDSAGRDNDALPEIIGELIEDISQLDHVQSVQKWPPPFLRNKMSVPHYVHSLYICFLPPSHFNPNRPDLVQNLTDLLNKTDMEYHLAGTGVIHKAINDLTSKASKRYLGIGIAVLLVFLILFTRNFQIILKTIGTSLGSVAFVIIAAWLMNLRFNTIMSVLPCLILFYSTSVSVHILNHQGDIRKVFWPTLTAVLTTCAGFSAFLLNSAPLLRDFGLLAIIGLLGGLFWALVLYYPEKNLMTTRIPLKNRLHEIEKWWNMRTMVLGIIFFLVLIPGALRIKSEIDIFSVLPADHKTVQDYHFIEDHIGSFVPIEYRIDLEQTDNRIVREWIEAVYQLDKVGAVMSYLAIPVWLNPKNFGYICQDGKTGRVVFYVPPVNTTEGLELVQQINSLARGLFPENHAIPKPTGYASLYVSVADHLAKSFRGSLLLAFVFVFLILFVYLRNLKLFLASIFPNLLPVLAILGVMGWFHIPVDMVTFPIGCMALGIIVDDTVHYLYWYRKSRDVQYALEKAGPGTIITSLIYILGFSVFLFADISPVRYFGVLSITTMIAALFGDIILLPQILKKVGQKDKLPEE